MIDDAVEFATKVHSGQFRKGSKRPYIIHPIEVADIVAVITQDEEMICAALLHDTIEDGEGITQDIIREKFGDRVAYLVGQESEDKSKSWIERKGGTIRRLKTASKDIKILTLADKLSNMRAIHVDYLLTGEAVWNKFRMKSKDALGWYYKGIRDALASELGELPAFKEFCNLVTEDFGEGPSPMDWLK